jgi:hypothetical protein
MKHEHTQENLISQQCVLASNRDDREQLASKRSNKVVCRRQTWLTACIVRPGILDVVSAADAGLGTVFSVAPQDGLAEAGAATAEATEHQ